MTATCGFTQQQRPLRQGTGAAHRDGEVLGAPLGSEETQPASYHAALNAGFLPHTRTLGFLEVPSLRRPSK